MPLKKALIIVEKKSGNETIEVLFNPNEYTLSSSNNYNWQTVPHSEPLGQFANKDKSSLSMELFCDSYEKGKDVRQFTSKIANLLEVDEKTGNPQVCRFVWGSLDFKGILEKLTQKFTMFLDSGIPVRATLSVTFGSWQDPSEVQSNTSGANDKTKQRTAKQGEQLWSVADQEYDDSSKWRNIADANGIDNPRRVQTGQSLTVPPVAESGE